MKKQALSIAGMHCASCGIKIELALMKTSGVQGASVDVASGKAVVEFDETVMGEPELRQAVEQTGYTVADVENAPASTTNSGRGRALLVIIAIVALLAVFLVLR